MFFLGDSYIDIVGGEKEVTQFIDDILNVKTKMVLSTKSLPNKTPVKLTEKNLKKYLKRTYYIISTL